jgi:hypothetical protein
LAGLESAVGTGGHIADRSRKSHRRLTRITLRCRKARPTFPSPTSTSQTPAAQTTTSNPADQEIKLLRERRTGAKPSDSSEIIAAFQGAEKKYPTDYRFPYERAKLSIAGVASHHEAFGALALAGEKAIDNGKAQEMLDSLTTDKDGDFYRLSRGHHEWQVLEEALKNKDRASLKALHH